MNFYVIFMKMNHLQTCLIVTALAATSLAPSLLPGCPNPEMRKRISFLPAIQTVAEVNRDERELYPEAFFTVSRQVAPVLTDNGGQPAQSQDRIPLDDRTIPEKQTCPSASLLPRELHHENPDVLVLYPSLHLTLEPI